MCRYAAIAYKPHYACFDCRKTFKRRLMWDIQRGADDKAEARCPQCGALMANMGKDFEAPKMSDQKAWRHIAELYKVGIAFHSCGCTGPGYIPSDADALRRYFEEQLADVETQLRFWRAREEPETSRLKQSEYDRKWEHLRQVPKKYWEDKETISNAAAVEFWLGRFHEIEAKLGQLSR
ncbi:MAG: hypothetical protein EOO15_10285 [Chitinophagaceae bacterium]|nr:MAG: hypothetical protein EOO15_10285 [Chitinophagaceae bacterium]